MVDDRWVATRMEMSVEQKWYLVDTPYYGNLEYVQAGITEELKAAEQMKWIGLMNNVRSAAEKIVLREMVYV